MACHTVGLVMAAALLAGLACASTAAPSAQRLKRGDGYFGVHFDFHAGKDCTEVGRNTTRKMVETILDILQPDYVQTDCKGHPGLTSYPTRVGNQAPGFVGDPLKVWREVTAERGVSLIMHYSGVWDSEAISRNPTWGVVNSDGSVNPNATSRFGPYADKLLIPQLREMNGEWGVDGAWVDGECWAAAPDWSAAAVAAFKKATGYDEAPRSRKDPHWYEFMQFNRQAFRDYLRHYIAEVRKTNPGMQLCSNWAFTDHMPEPVSIPVDWISGDFSPSDSVDSARFSARYIAGQGKPWDLMAWSFAAPPNTPWQPKSAPQLMREAALVLALGGGFQAYITQNRDGSVDLGKIPVMGEVGKFVRARQPYCRGAAQVPQVALLYSTYDHYRRAGGLFSRDLGSMSGTLEALVEGRHSVSIVGEHMLKAKMGAYPLIVLPETQELEPAFVSELTAYVRGGGSLLLVGPGPARLFADLLSGATERQAGGDTVAYARVGKGAVASMPGAFSQAYLANQSAEARAKLSGAVGLLFEKPLVEVSGSDSVDVVVTRVKRKLSVQLVNCSGPHRSIEHPIIASIDPIGPLTVRVRRATKPAKVTLQPDGIALAFTHSKGIATVTVPKLEIHGVVVVE